MSKVLKAIEAAKKAWCNENPQSNETPWDSCNTLEFKDGSKTCWLNPPHQQHLNYGPVTEGDLQDWLDGKVGQIIVSQEKWDELLYMCKSGTVLIGYELEFFNRHPTKYLLAPGVVRQPGDASTRVVGTGFPNRMQMPKKKGSWEPQRMSPEMIREVEGHIKWMLRQDFEEQLAWDSTASPYHLYPKQTTQEEIYGFTFALKQMGLETISHGYGNTPTERENFAWWRNLLVREAHWELLTEKGLAYEPWMKNGKSTFSSKTEE